MSSPSRARGMIGIFLLVFCIVYAIGLYGLTLCAQYDKAILQRDIEQTRPQSGLSSIIGGRDRLGE